MLSFQYSALPARVIFGTGTIGQLGNELVRCGVRRALFLSTPGHEEYVRSCAEKVGPASAGVFAGATMHTPISVTDQALEMARKLEIDGVVAIGGGSTTGLGKAIAWRTDLPQIVVPTTFAGSEMTPILGETKDGQKVTISDPKIQPEIVIYDVELTKTLPTEAAVASGMNALAHAVEALYAENRNPVVSLMAAEAIASLTIALPNIVENAPDSKAHEQALYGAWLSGVCLGSVAMSLHHKLCHVLGGLFNLPHSEMHAILLPHVVAYNTPAIPDIAHKLRSLFQSSDPAQALFGLNRRLGIKPSLADIGMPVEGIETAVAAVLAKPYWNPRALERDGLVALLKHAYAGLAPAVS
jgi:alcohol dehydrogenase class IV